MIFSFPDIQSDKRAIIVVQKVVLKIELIEI